MKAFVTSVLSLAVGLSLVFASPAVAGSKDYCISDGGALEFVCQDFKIHGPGKCRQCNGFFTPPDLANSLTGAACTASDNSHVTFTLTTTATAIPGFAEIINVQLALPDVSGVTSGTFAGTVVGGGTFSTTVTGESCIRDVP